jgi:hypothetical protein
MLFLNCLYSSGSNSLKPPLKNMFKYSGLISGRLDFILMSPVNSEYVIAVGRYVYLTVSEPIKF